MGLSNYLKTSHVIPQKMQISSCVTFALRLSKGRDPSRWLMVGLAFNELLQKFEPFARSGSADITLLTTSGQGIFMLRGTGCHQNGSILTLLFRRELHILNMDRVIEPGDVIGLHPLG